MIKKYKIVILSDLHLGLSNSNPKDILKFLNSIEAETIILNGDIIDIDALNRGHKWKTPHNKVIMKLLEMSKKTKIIYVRGNHDDGIKNLYNINLTNIEFVNEYLIHIQNGEDEKKYLVLHGDKIENGEDKLNLLYKIGSYMYDVVISFNSFYNSIRSKLNLPYHSMTKSAKKNVKKIMSFIFNFETNAITLADKMNCDGIICGHIHTPIIKKVLNIEYLNSGDWVENRTALVLTDDNHWLLLDFS